MSDAAVARLARNGVKKGCLVSFSMIFGRFLGENAANCFRVCCTVLSG